MVEGSVMAGYAYRTESVRRYYVNFIMNEPPIMIPELNAGSALRRRSDSRSSGDLSFMRGECFVLSMSAANTSSSSTVVTSADRNKRRSVR